MAIERSQVPHISILRCGITEPQGTEGASAWTASPAVGAIAWTASPAPHLGFEMWDFCGLLPLSYLAR
jgi:hypothetical protein